MHHNIKIFRAWRLAAMAHATQTRKYNGDKYIVHLAEVAALTNIFTDGDVDAICAAWLHDIVEDQGYPLSKINDDFGDTVALYVDFLTEKRPEGYNRKQRHILYNTQLGSAPTAVQNVKAADIISNVGSIAKNDPAFAVTYIPEKQATLDVLTKLSPTVRIATAIEISTAQRTLDESRVQDWLQKREHTK